MSTESGSLPATSTQHRPSIAAVASALGSTKRWQILSELSVGEALMVKEIAERIGCSADLTSRHLAGMRQTGLVVSGRARLYTIPKQYLPFPGQRIIDYGHCVLRLDATQ